MIRKLLLLVLALSITACSGYPSGTLIFVTNERAGSISVIDAATNKVIDTIHTGARPRGIRVSKDGKHAYVAITSPLNAVPKAEENRVAVFDTSTGAIIRSIQVGMDPEQIAVDADEKR